MTYKEHDLVMLPANQKSSRMALMIVTETSLSSKKWQKSWLQSDANNKLLTHSQYHRGQHLYILSDEEIKKGDWCIMTNDFGDKYIVLVTILKTSDDYIEVRLIINNQKNCCSKDKLKKIIATTDVSLNYNIHGQSTITKIPQSLIDYFVEEHNKGNIITKVMLEYEPKRQKLTTGELVIGSSADYNLQLKINPDNTINIQAPKDSWTRDEVIELFEKYQYDYAQWVLKMEDDINGKPIPSEWIKENI